MAQSPLNSPDTSGQHDDAAGAANGARSGSFARTDPIGGGSTAGWNSDMMCDHPKPAGSSAPNRMLGAAMSLLRYPAASTPELDQIAHEAGVDPLQARALFPHAQAVYESAAECALLWLNDACVKAVVKVDPGNAMAQFEALGEAYLDWAVTNESHFRLITGGHLPGLSGNPRLQRYHDAMRELMVRMLERARDSGTLAPDENIPLMVMAGRSFAYGLARMVIDGRMAEWYPGTPPMDAARQALHDYVYRIARASMPRDPARRARSA